MQLIFIGEIQLFNNHTENSCQYSFSSRDETTSSEVARMMGLTEEDNHVEVILFILISIIIIVSLINFTLPFKFSGLCSSRLLAIHPQHDGKGQGVDEKPHPWDKGWHLAPGTWHLQMASQLEKLQIFSPDIPSHVGCCEVSPRMFVVHRDNIPANSQVILHLIRAHVI